MTRNLPHSTKAMKRVCPGDHLFLAERESLALAFVCPFNCSSHSSAKITLLPNFLQP